MINSVAKSDPKPILLVEDSEDDVFLFKRALTQARLSNPLQVVTTLASATRYLNGDGPFADRSLYPVPSILVVDLKLPDGSGLEFLRWVRSQPKFHGLHCLVATGNLRGSVPQDCYAAGADSFLRKPCHHQELQNLATGFPQHWVRL